MVIFRTLCAQLFFALLTTPFHTLYDRLERRYYLWLKFLYLFDVTDGQIPYNHSMCGIQTRLTGNLCAPSSTAVTVTLHRTIHALAASIESIGS